MNIKYEIYDIEIAKHSLPNTVPIRKMFNV